MIGNHVDGLYCLKGSNPLLSVIELSWPVGQAVKTPPFHGGNTGSSPVRVTTWRHSSAGRALASHARGHRFEFCCLHQNPEAVRLQDFFIATRNGKRDDGVREERLSPALGRRDESLSSRGPQCVSILCFLLFILLAVYLIR